MHPTFHSMVLPSLTDDNEHDRYFVVVSNDPERAVIFSRPHVRGTSTRDYLESLPEGLHCVGLMRDRPTCVAPVMWAKGGTLPAPALGWPWSADKRATRRAIRAAAYVGATLGWFEHIALVLAQNEIGWFDVPLFEVHALGDLTPAEALSLIGGSGPTAEA